MTLRLGWAQICAIAFYEMRMLWRQRMLAVFTLSLIVLTGILLFLLRGAAGEQYDSSFVSSNTIGWIGLVWPLLYTQLLLLSGLTVVDVMPRDRLWNVKPIIDGTPLPRSVYLLGKLSGAWLAIVLSLIIVMLGAGVLGWWLVGPYEVSRYLQMWLGGALPLALLHVGLSLMLAAFMPTRRAAVMIVLLFGLACSVLGSLNSKLTEIDLWGLLNPGRPYIYDYFWLGWVDAGHRTPLGESVIWLSAGIGLCELLGCGIMAWLWLRMREGRE